VPLTTFEGAIDELATFLGTTSDVPEEKTLTYLITPSVVSSVLRLDK
jgi:hypothetical protein